MFLGRTISRRIKTGPTRPAPASCFPVARTNSCALLTQRWLKQRFPATLRACPSATETND